MRTADQVATDAVKDIDGAEAVIMLVLRPVGDGDKMHVETVCAAKFDITADYIRQTLATASTRSQKTVAGRS